VIQALTRAKKYNAPATLTIPEWLKILDHFKGKCAYCGRNFEIIEHIIAITAGGGTTALNCVPGCLGCNATKDRNRCEYPMPQEKIEKAKSELLFLFSKVS